jgi:hypothetical protein
MTEHFGSVAKTRGIYFGGVRTFTGTRIVMTGIFRGFPYSIQTNSETVRQIRFRPLSSAYFPIYYSPIIGKIDCVFWTIDSAIKQTGNK